MTVPGGRPDPISVAGKYNLWIPEPDPAFNHFATTPNTYPTQLPTTVRGT